MGFGIYTRLIQLKTKLIALKYFNLHIHNKAIIEGDIEVTRGGEVYIGKDTRIRRWVCFRPYGGKITIGEKCTINSFCHISGNGDVEIGNNVLIATQCVIISANHRFDKLNIPINQQGEVREKITIGDNCWLGAGVKILAGVTIHEGCVIGAGSVITCDIPANSVVVGVPGRIVRSRCEGES